MAKPGTSKAIRERAEKRKAKTETERVKTLEKTDAQVRGFTKTAREAARKLTELKGRTISDEDIKRLTKLYKQKKK